MDITKGMKLRFNALRAGGLCDKQEFVVTKVLNRKAELFQTPPVVGPPFNGFKIDINDLKAAIEIGYYTVITEKV